MTQIFSIFLWSITGFVICGAAALLSGRASSENINALEKLTRNRYVGLFFGWFALFVCVPHAQAIAPAFMLIFLYPLAFIVPILRFFFVDYPASRAVSGTLTLAAYNLVHLSFDHSVCCAPFFAVCAWIAGAFAIWCSGLPWTWRDLFRKCAQNTVFKRIVSGIFWFFAAVFAAFAGVVFI